MRKIISVVLSFGLLFQQSGLLYAAGEINLANYLSQARNAIVQPDRFQPARLRYISYDMANNDFKLLLDKSNAKLNDATPELFNYFLIGLALPNDIFWVNLRPDAPENIIDPILEKTDIGKIFLETDLQLKKDTAGLTSPQNPEGKSYWDKLYKKAGELFGTENITIPTITRPWIVPNEVIVRETEDSAYIYKATLKVMLESDYLIGRGGSRTAPTPDQYAFSDPRLKELNEYSTQLIRETIIPKLTKEVNSSKRYAQLRQVYYSLILARWFKQKYSSHGSAGASANSYLSLIDSGNLANLASKESYDKQTYFQAYQKSFKDGEYNLKETVPTPSGQSIRNYVSGGISVGSSSIILDKFNTPKKENMEVTKALTDQIPSVTTASPLEVKQVIKALKEIHVGLKDIGAIVIYLSRPENGYNSNIQGVSNSLRQVMSVLHKKINYLGQMRTERMPIEDISYFGELRNDLGGIQSAINKFVEISFVKNNSRNINGSIENKFNNLSEGIEKVLKQTEGLDKDLQTSVGSPLTRLGDFLSALESESNNIYNEEAKNAISRLINTIKQQIELIRKGKYRHETINIGKTMIEGEWKDLCDQMPGIEKTLSLKYNDVIKAIDELLKSYSKVAALPVIGVELYGVNGENGKALRYISFKTLPDNMKQSLRNSVAEMKLSPNENYNEYENMRFAIEVIDQTHVEVYGILVYDGKTKARSRIELPQWVAVYNKPEAVKKELAKAWDTEVGMGEKFWRNNAQNRISAGSPVLGEKLVVLDENGKVIEYLRFVSYDKDIKGKNRIMLKDIMDKLKGTAFLSGDGGAVYHFTLDSSNLSGMYFAVELDGSGRVVYLKGILRIVNGKRETLGGKNQEVINALKNKEKEIVSSAVEVIQESEKWGGIDLTDRALHIKLERVGSFAATPLLLPQVKNGEGLDLDREFEQIEALASSGIVPNSHRILELFTVCHYRGEFGQRLTQIISCLKASSAIQEAEAIDSDEDFRLALMMPEVLS